MNNKAIPDQKKKKNVAKHEMRNAFKAAVEELVKLKPNIGSNDPDLRHEANTASMTVRKLMQDLHGKKDSAYICKVMKRYEIT